MNGIGSVAENLKAAIGGEHYEFTQMYPVMIEQAKVEKNGAALKSFNWANKVEQIHHGLYQQARRPGGGHKEGEQTSLCVSELRQYRRRRSS
jgi:rubrerythrin